MSEPIFLQLILGKWRTSKHSNRREKDDTHIVKAKILKAAKKLAQRRGDYDEMKRVGNNPDLRISDDGQIALKAVDSKKKGRVYVTGLKAEDFFVLSFIIKDENVEIELSKPTTQESEVEAVLITFATTYVIPFNSKILDSSIDYCIEICSENQTPIFLIVKR